MAQACHYAQSHIDDPEAWSMKTDNREEWLQCTSFQIACFLSQNTVRGRNGVDWDVVLQPLIEHPCKSVKEWEKILQDEVDTLEGWRDHE